MHPLVWSPGSWGFMNICSQNFSEILSVHNQWSNLGRPLFLVLILFLKHSLSLLFCGIIIGKKTTTTTTTTPEWLHFEPLQSNLGSWFLLCSRILTQLEEIWKTTSIFLKMEDNPNFFKGKKQPNFFGKWKTSKKIMQPKIIKSKNNNIFVNGWRPKLFLKKEDNLNF
jgi:hypothetical protein